MQLPKTSAWKRWISTFETSHASLGLVLYALAVVLAGDMLLRILFFLYNFQEGWDFAWRDVPLALLVGLRFDLATIAVTNGLVLVLMAMPFGAHKRVSGWLILTFLLLHLPVTLLNGIDVIYYGFSSKRLSHEFFSGGKEAANFGWQEFLPYWWLILLVMALAVGQWWLLRRAAARLQPTQPRQVTGKIWRWVQPLVVAALLLLAFRGGLQTRPLRPAMAFVTSSIFLGNVSLNSAYTVAQSMEIGNEEEMHFMPLNDAIARCQQLVRNDFDGPFENPDYPLLRKTQFAEPERRSNVVILVVESLNANKLGCINGKPLTESLTPNLDTLARRGKLFTNFFSNGSRSVQSLPAILNSTPDLFERPLIGSSFETNQQWGIGNILAQRGYRTSFLCGGPNGTLGFDSYATVSGFQKYYGQSDYPGPDAQVVCNWGLHDHPTLTWLADLQAQTQQPFLNVWFSISNHHPFDLPADCPAEIAQSDLSPMDKTVRYTDWALGQYFAAVLPQAWAQNTIFVLTGDHCFYFEDDPDRGDAQNFHVPLLLFGPGITPEVSDREGSHISIMPTLIDLLRLKTRYAGLGVSMLSQRNDPFGITGVMGVGSLMHKHRYFSTSFESIMGCLRLQNGVWSPDAGIANGPEGAELDVMIRSIFQTCSYMRHRNRQNLPRGMEAY